ncbi:hypothetical protein COCON_G00089130 [Conger conger]|uniref:Uncharacterized protein n=1 Tax=Conger conger TaxID=82655 RepID=A0A9Q1DKM6_CONCO|nr:hypothetical protein COCON_G00089130 [Conger conger]
MACFDPGGAEEVQLCLHALATARPLDWLGWWTLEVETGCRTLAGWHCRGPEPLDEARAKQQVQELAAMEAQAVQREAALQVTVTSLQKELERLKEAHHVETSSLQQTRAHLLKLSEQGRSSQEQRAEQLVEKLQWVRAELEEAQARADGLQEELRSRQEELQSASEALIIKESEVTRLQAKISSYGRKADLQNASLLCESAFQPPAPLPSRQEEAPFSDWADEESLGLPPSVRACLREHSWQGLSRLDTSSSSELSFNPLTYAASEDTLLGPPGPPGPEDTFTSMLQFLSRTTAAQDSAPSWLGSCSTLSSECLKGPKEAHRSSTGDV